MAWRLALFSWGGEPIATATIEEAETAIAEESPNVATIEGPITAIAEMDPVPVFDPLIDVVEPEVDQDYVANVFAAQRAWDPWPT